MKQMLVDWYAAYSTTDEARYKEFVVEEYMLLWRTESSWASKMT